MGNLTYIVQRKAGQPYDFSKERFTIHGPKRKKVVKALILSASILFGKAPGGIDAQQQMIIGLKLLKELSLTDGYRILPVAMTDTPYPMMRARLNCLLAQYSAGVLSTDDLMRTYKKELSYLVELHPDELKLMDGDGRYVHWNDSGQIELDVCEEELDGEDFSLVEASEELKAQLAALGLKYFYWQCSMNPDGTPTDDDFEHQTYGTIAEDGEFIPVVTILDWSHPVVARREPLQEDA